MYTNIFPLLSKVLFGLSLVVFFFSKQLRGYGLPILIIWTALESILVGIICSLYPADLVLTALVITAIIVVSLTVYACNAFLTKAQQKRISQDWGPTYLRSASLCFALGSRSSFGGTNWLICSIVVSAASCFLFI